MAGRSEKLITIQERAYLFGLRIMRLVRELPAHTAAQVLVRQIARSGSSIGANAEEAAAAQTRREFVQKMSIARKEARETQYWLRMIRDLGLVKRTRLDPLIQESAEIVAILTATVKTGQINLRKGDSL
jgi:four helix bundle protein